MAENRSNAASKPSRQEADREHFDSIAETYARKDLRASSRCARRRRLESTLARVPMEESWRILEVGCGAGFAAAYLEGRYSSYVGIDQSGRLIEIAGSLNGRHDVEFIATDIEQLAMAGDFDLAFMIGVLHHLTNRESALAKIIGLLRPGAYIAVNEPQPANFAIRAARRLRARIDRSYSDDQDQIPHEELVRTLEGAGLIDVTVWPQGLLSTPFAEVPIGPQLITAGIAHLACRVDVAIEAGAPRLLSRFSWNLIAVGRKPEVAGNGLEEAR
ncbi:MAG TPA: class I SAM-dependent methyltransferase [Candidatus Sulfomarinibacteraceae bacterium]|nr:class I SAM-dependent methyltransferase [Candidatus Sulfomarinibacteraceae bacterium]